jgi:hypothetical protein
MQTAARKATIDSSTRDNWNAKTGGNTISKRDVNISGEASNSREVRNNRDQSNSWDSRNAIGSNNIGNCRDNCGRRGNKNINDKLEAAEVLATEGRPATADIPGLSWTSYSSRGARNSRHFSNRRDPSNSRIPRITRIFDKCCAVLTL